MACFLVTTAEAAVVTAAAMAVRKQEQKKLRLVKHSADRETLEEKAGVSWSRKLMWLAYLLWGGALLLAFEHVWHGEVVPWFPFLSAMRNPGDTADMLHEMATVGVTMAGIVTAVWALLCLAADAIVKRRDRQAEAAA